MGVCRGMCQYATAGTPCDCKCSGALHGIRAGLHAPTTTAGKLHIDLEYAGQQVMMFDDLTEIQTAEAPAGAPEADADMTGGAGTSGDSAPAPMTLVGPLLLVVGPHPMKEDPYRAGCVLAAAALNGTGDPRRHRAESATGGALPQAPPVFVGCGATTDEGDGEERASAGNAGYAAPRRTRRARPGVGHDAPSTAPRPSSLLLSRTGGAGLATAGPAPEATTAGDDHGATDLPLHHVRTDDASTGLDSVGHVHGANNALPGVPHGGDDHHDRRRAVLLDGFRVVPVTREWREGGAWREWRGWRIDDKRCPFYGDTPEDAIVAARRGSLRIVMAA